MKAVAFFVAVAVCFAVSNCQEMPDDPDAPPLGPSITVSYDSIQPLSQPTPRSNTEKSAVNFKPRLAIADNKCWPHAVVTVDGRVSSGLPREKSNCVTIKGQVYGRSGWAGSNWGNMYSYWVPYLQGGTFETMVVWINNPSTSTTQEIVSVSTQNSAGAFSSQKPGPNVLTGNHTEVIYDKDVLSFNPKRNGGDFLLIMWHQLSDAAKRALNNTSNFNGNPVPFNDINFNSTLHDASKTV